MCIRDSYCPWLSEVSINTDTPVSEWGHTAAHEIAHTMGFAREDACNFVAYLACVSSDNPDFVYSGYLAAFTYCANALYDYDKDAFRTVFLSPVSYTHLDVYKRQPSPLAISQFLISP